ncbi:MAG: hypothetical protein ISS47_05325 [Candidatus Omnitrophica bacterium]|nr:hypothetical protein [Candidatus Omnitrophota bacterium]
MVYLFVGIDEISKERKIRRIKQENFQGKENSFDYELFYADTIDRLKLIDSLNRLPLQAKKRIVVIKQVEKFSPANRKILLSFIKTPHNYNILILDTEISDLKNNKFVLDISRYAKIFNFKKERLLTVFDLADAIVKKNTAIALKILFQLISKGERPHRLLGALSWKWNKIQEFLTNEEFKKGLRLFFETDVNIKSGRLKPNFALELLVIKLCDLRLA